MSRAKKAHKHTEIPRKSSGQDPTPKVFMWRVLFLENKGQEPPPPHKELGLPNLYAGDPFNSLYGYSLCASFAPSYDFLSDLSQVVGLTLRDTPVPFYTRTSQQVLDVGA